MILMECQSVQSVSDKWCDGLVDRNDDLQVDAGFAMQQYFDPGGQVLLLEFGYSHPAPWTLSSKS